MSKIMPKQFLNSSKPTSIKPRERIFLTLKVVKLTLSDGQNLSLNFDFRGHIYIPLELKIQVKVGLLRSKIMPKQLLNNPKPTFKKSKKRLFCPSKWSNHGYQF